MEARRAVPLALCAPYSGDATVELCVPCADRLDPLPPKGGAGRARRFKQNAEVYGTAGVLLALAEFKARLAKMRKT